MLIGDHKIFWIFILETLIIAPQEFDFNELESSTEYDGGFSRQTPCVGWYELYSFAYA